MRSLMPRVSGPGVGTGPAVSWLVLVRNRERLCADGGVDKRPLKMV